MSVDLNAISSASLADQEIPEYNLETQASDSVKPFLGIIVRDGFTTNIATQGKYAGQTIKKWDFAVRPVDYAIGGKTGAWPCYIPVQRGSDAVKSKNSIVMKTLDSLRRTFGSRDEQGRTRDIMKGQLLGLVGYFVRKDEHYGRKGEEGFDFEGALYAVAAASAEEEARARALPAHVPVSEAPTGEQTIRTQESKQIVRLTPELTEKLRGLYVGRTPTEAAREVALNAEAYLDVRDFVFDGTGLDALKTAGLVAVVDGKVEAL